MRVLLEQGIDNKRHDCSSQTTHHLYKACSQTSQFGRKTFWSEGVEDLESTFDEKFGEKKSNGRHFAHNYETCHSTQKVDKDESHLPTELRSLNEEPVDKKYGHFSKCHPQVLDEPFFGGANDERDYEYFSFEDDILEKPNDTE